MVMMKTKCCSKCKIKKKLFEFSKDRSRKDGLYPQCKLCGIKYARQFYQTNCAGIAEKHKKYNQTPAGRKSQRKGSKKQREKFPERIEAHNAINHAIAAGKLERPSHCEDCRKKRFTDGHHESYEEIHWLDVNWLCIGCHKKLHRELLESGIEQC